MKRIVSKITTLLGTAALAISSMCLTVFAEGEAAGEASGGAQQTGTNMGWLMIVIYIAFFALIGYFLIFRPNKKRRKQEEELRSSIVLGDEVTTIGGIVGRVVNIKDDNITIETSLDKTLMEFKNWAIREVKKPVTDDEPSDNKDSKDKKDK